MKLKMLFLAFAISAFAMVPLAVSYGGGAYENPSPGTFKSPDLQGNIMPESSSAGLNSYKIGFRNNIDNSCKVETIKAESSHDALMAAKDECPKCRVEDLTGKEVAAEAPWGNVPLAEAYCNPLMYNPAYQ